MTAWTRGLGLSLGLALVVCSLVKSDEAKVTGDLKKLQGTWLPKNGIKALQWVFDGDKMMAKFGDNDFVTKVLVNKDATPYPTIDFEIKEGSDEAKGKTAKAIYKLEDDDDTLTVCVAFPDNDGRPNEFRAVENESILFELKREKDKK